MGFFYVLTGNALHYRIPVSIICPRVGKGLAPSPGERLIMNSKTHKTVRVNARMETDLCLDINVPLDAGEEDIAQFIREGNILAEDMVEVVLPHSTSGGWMWLETDYHFEFDPKALPVMESKA